MKFEDLKLPVIIGGTKAHEICEEAARQVYDQMHAHYETKLAKPEPEELFEHPDMPGKKFRRLKVGERIQEGDWAASKGTPLSEGFFKTMRAGLFVDSDDSVDFYREVPHPTPEWRLPDPPPGQQWHRDDWTQDMLPEGYRPLLLGEVEQPEDEFWGSLKKQWFSPPCYSDVGARPRDLHRRTRRPLPAPVEYVPLEPEDVPPGSAVRKYNGRSWDLVTSVDSDNLWVQGDCHPWQYLAGNYEILRPNSTIWEPCKKPKA